MAAVFSETNPNYVRRKWIDCGIAGNNFESDYDIKILQ